MEDTKQQTKQETLNKPNKAVCPECGAPMIPASGCAYCVECGYSPCR